MRRSSASRCSRRCRPFPRTTITPPPSMGHRRGSGLCLSPCPQVHLNDTYVGIMLAQTSGALPFCMWTLKSYMDAVPGELVEASLMDGCSKLGTYLRIVLPTSLPGLAVAAFYAFTVSWGDYLFVSVISGSDHTATLPIYLYRIRSSQTMNWGTIAATTVLSILPVLIVFAFVQRWLIEGLLAGAVKG